jgi:hypothetical protein
MFTTNDLHGFINLSKKEKRYVPCERMVGFHEGILGTSWNTVTYFMYDEDDHISCKSVRMPGFECGDSVTELLAKGNTIFGGSHTGNMYTFSFDETYSWVYS